MSFKFLDQLQLTFALQELQELISAHLSMAEKEAMSQNQVFYLFSKFSCF
jgi:hypothetical protein